MLLHDMASVYTFHHFWSFLGICMMMIVVFQFAWRVLGPRESNEYDYRLRRMG